MADTANNLTKAKTRDANMELLRIIAMLLIVLSHSIMHSGVMSELDQERKLFAVVWFIRYVCKISVPLFVMIGSYYQCGSEQFRLTKITKLWRSTVFYGLTIFIIMLFLQMAEPKVWYFVYKIFPITAYQYWFISVYVCLLAVQPFYNMLIHRISREQHLLIIVILMMLFSVIPTLGPSDQDFSGVKYGSSLSFFTLLHFIAAYLRYYPPKKRKKSVYLVTALALTLISTGITILLFWIHRTTGAVPVSDKLYLKNSPLVVGAAICIFLLFRDISVSGEKLGKVICTISSATFAVYLIHENYYIRKWLWHTMFQPAAYADTRMLIPYICGCTIVIFTVCCAIGLAVNKLFSYVKLGAKMDAGVDRLQEKILRIIHNVCTSEKVEEDRNG